jgi:hypothetical protein
MHFVQQLLKIVGVPVQVAGDQDTFPAGENSAYNGGFHALLLASSVLSHYSKSGPKEQGEIRKENGRTIHTETGKIFGKKPGIDPETGKSD